MLTAGFGVGVVAFLVGLVVAFVFYVLAASHLKRTFYTLAEKSGEDSFRTAATLLWIGSILTIIGIGLLLILVAWIFATIGFFTMKSRQYQQYTPQPNGYGATPLLPSQRHKQLGTKCMNRSIHAQSKAKSNDAKSLYANQTEKGLTEIVSTRRGIQ